VCAKSQMGFRRLVSLLEILQIYADAYVQCVNFLQSAANTVLQREDFWDDPMFTPFLQQWMVRLEEICEKDELPVTKVLVIQVGGLLRIAHDADNPMSKVTPHVLDKDVLFQHLERIRLTFIDELSTKLFFQLPNNRKQWFEAPTKGWEKIIEHFPDTTADVEEMNKCFALSRYTAAVFHSLLVVESGLIALGELIGARDKKVGWDATCKRMQELLTAGHGSYPADILVSFSVLEQINQSTQAMKLAWRNKVNHVAGKLMVMSTGFAPDIAEEIILATRAFMRRLATALPESSV
jgi:enamine deaminase RidA (YjgF/YER057c/UK114 family)